MASPSLAGKAAVITGSSRGIGRAIALKLAGEGAHCILTGRDREALAGVAAEIESQGGQAHWTALDLRDPSAAPKLIGFALAQAGRIDIVVNNAGATKRAEFLELSEQDWTDGFALKFFGAVRVTREAWPHLQSTGGAVLNIAGAGGRTPGSSFAVGGSVNAAMLALTKSLADTGLQDGIQVNAINPGSVRTGRLDKRLADLAARRHIEPAAAERLLVENEKISRIGEPHEIADLVCFIVGPSGRFLHGALIDMDGGATKTI